MNPLPAIAVYAALQRAAGEPLHFPGTETPRTLREAVDADLVAARAGVGGDVAGGRRRHVQPHERRRVLLGHRLAGHRRRVRHGRWASAARCRSPRDLPRRDAEWAALVAAHDLGAPPTIDGLVGANSLVYADVVMAEQQTASPIVNSTIAARQAGFADCRDTADMFVALLHRIGRALTVSPGLIRARSRAVAGRRSSIRLRGRIGDSAGGDLAHVSESSAADRRHGDRPGSELLDVALHRLGPRDGLGARVGDGARQRRPRWSPSPPTGCRRARGRRSSPPRCRPRSRPRSPSTVRRSRPSGL